MRRRLLALAAASGTAPYLTSFFLSGYHARMRGVDGMGDVVEFIINLVILGSAGLILYGLPVLVAGGILAALSAALGFYNRMTATVMGALSGAGFGLGLFLWDGDYTVLWAETYMVGDVWPTLMSFGLSGAICGSIYWSIAAGRTPRNGHAIEAG